MKTLIIAEAGVNHNGDLAIAKKLIGVAANAGADIVKFQTFKTESLVTKTASMAPYQKVNMKSENGAATQFEMLKKLELSEDDHFELIKECKKLGIEFLSTAFDLESADFLNSLGLSIFKIPSGEITNYPLIKKIGSFAKKVIFSTGMAEVFEIEYCLNILIKNGTKREDITILQCTTEYPTPDTDVNLLTMQTIKDKFNVSVGFSDHSVGTTMPIAAVALGASVIEKHFTLDKTMDGPDHKASLDPSELLEMVKSIRRVELGLGSSEKKISPSEINNKKVARKSVVAKMPIFAGEEFSEKNITVKRPSSGISPIYWEDLIGRPAKASYSEDELLDLSELDL